MAVDVQNTANVAPAGRGARGMSTLHMLIFAGLLVLGLIAPFFLYPSS
jgi:hypothetical protein